MLSAFACDPLFGSDEEVGWQWARKLAARGYRVTVLTRVDNRPAIEKAMQQTGDCRSVAFEYIDVYWFYKLCKLISNRNHVYYYFWQVFAWWHARGIVKAGGVDMVHHVTWVSFRQPSFMGLLGLPFVYGPVAGGDEIPRGYMADFSLKQRFLELARVALNRVVRFDPLMLLTFATADEIYFTSEAHPPRLPARFGKRARVELAIGCDTPDQTNARRVAAQHREGPRSRAPRLVFVGRCIGWKGLDIGLPAFAKVLKQCPQATLTVIGDGVEKERWMRCAVRLGIDRSVEWKGWLAKEEVTRTYPEFDMLFNPSLRDSGGFVVLESLGQGVPVVCFNLGGPGQIVQQSCGEVVQPPHGIDAAIEAFAQATLRMIERVRDREEGLAEQCMLRAANFTWDALVDRMYGPARTQK